MQLKKYIYLSFAIEVGIGSVFLMKKRSWDFTSFPPKGRGIQILNNK
jgi:hypothetical protein